MATHRRYTRQQKAEAVAEAERTSLTAASESLGLPLNTVKYWMDAPEFADVRMKTRDELALGSVTMAVIAQAELVRRIQTGRLSDQALVAAYGVGIDKAQLLLGEATSRTEHRDVADPDERAVTDLRQRLADGPPLRPVHLVAGGNGTGTNGKH